MPSPRAKNRAVTRINAQAPVRWPLHSTGAARSPTRTPRTLRGVPSAARSGTGARPLPEPQAGSALCWPPRRLRGRAARERRWGGRGRTALQSADSPRKINSLEQRIRAISLLSKSPKPPILFYFVFPVSAAASSSSPKPWKAFHRNVFLPNWKSVWDNRHAIFKEKSSGITSASHSLILRFYFKQSWLDTNGASKQLRKMRIALNFAVCLK